MALTFISGNPRIDLGSLPNLSGTAAMTVAAWIKLASVNSDATIALRGALFSTSAPWLLWRDDSAGVSGRINTLSALLNTDVGLLRVESAADALNDTTTWHHVALVFEGDVSDGLRLYIDGVRDTHVTSTVGHASVVADASTVTAGIDDSGRAFAGDMAELALWGVVLSDAEIALLAEGVSPGLLRNRFDGLHAYHALIANVNRPGVGPVATKHGTFNTTDHPRVRPLRGLSPAVDSTPELTPGAYQTAIGQHSTARDEAAQSASTGAEGGSLYPQTAF